MEKGIKRAAIFFLILFPIFLCDAIPIPIFLCDADAIPIHDLN